MPPLPAQAGRGVERDVDKGVALIRQAADNGFEADNDAAPGDDDDGADGWEDDEDWGSGWGKQ